MLKPVHVQMMHRALDGRFSVRALAVIVDANVRVDSLRNLVGHAEYHFDDNAFDRDGQLFPVEQPTWNSAAVVLAAHALAGDGPTAGLFRGEGLPLGLTPAELLAAGAEIEAGMARKQD